MQEALGELFDQRNYMMPEHTLSQRTNMKAIHCQELVCLLGVLVCLEVPFTMVPSKNSGKVQSNTVPRKSKEGCKLT